MYPQNNQDWNQAPTVLESKPLQRHRPSLWQDSVRSNFALKMATA